MMRIRNLTLQNVSITVWNCQDAGINDILSAAHWCAGNAVVLKPSRAIPVIREGGCHRSIDEQWLHSDFFAVELSKLVTLLSRVFFTPKEEPHFWRFQTIIFFHLEISKNSEIFLKFQNEISKKSDNFRRYPKS